MTMKKLSLLLLAWATTFALQAQWVDDPAQNTIIANADSNAGEIYLATDNSKGSTYVQWISGGSNGYAPSLQRLSIDGTPQWGDDGIRITGHEFYSSSEGVAMAVTADGAVVSCFATANDQTAAVKINTDGTYAWGAQGVTLFDGNGFSRTELVAGDDGGVWAMGSDYNKLYLQYIEADGTLNPTITVASAGNKVQYGKLTLGNGNTAFLSYERIGNGFYTQKDIYVAGFTKEGETIGPEVELMTPQIFQVTYIHYVVPDGMGGGYVYIWHSGSGNFNTYVFHYDANGLSTINNPSGAAVHTDDPSHYYLDAHATVDPVSHDIIIAYIQANASIQSIQQVYVNRITPTGEKVWGDGFMVAPYEGTPYSSVRVDAFEDGSGFVVMYEKAIDESGYLGTYEAIGMDMEGNTLWNKTISSNVYSRTLCKNTTGFHFGQDIVTWVNSDDGGIYGQNIQPNGNMGQLPQGCPGPNNFQGEYVYDDDTQSFGVQLSWDEPEEPVDFYRLFRTNLATDEESTVDFDGDVTTYFDEAEIGRYKYQLKAQYAEVDCGLSNPATTPNGDVYVFIRVTGIDENTTGEIVTLVKVFNANGQSLQCKDLNELGTGLYILQGLTEDGTVVCRKIIVRK